MDQLIELMRRCREDGHTPTYADLVALENTLPGELQSLRSERTAWRVTAENAEKDAARYRWLRVQHWEENRLGVVVRPKDQTKLGSFLPSGSLLDDAIDHMSTIEATEETP